MVCNPETTAFFFCSDAATLQSSKEREERGEIGYEVAVNAPLSLFGGDKRTQSRKKGGGGGGGGGTQGCHGKEPVADKKKTTEERLSINAVEEQMTQQVRILFSSSHFSPLGRTAMHHLLPLPSK